MKTCTLAGQPGEAVTGTVTFFDGHDAGNSTAGKRSGKLQHTSYKVSGIHTIVASYSGDLHNSPSTSTLTEDIAIVRLPSTMVLTTSGSPSLIGQAVTFTTRVTWQYGTAPNGELVTFYAGTRTLGSVALAGGFASYTTSSLTLGTHSIKATYAGDASFSPSSATVAQVVNGSRDVRHAQFEPEPLYLRSILNLDRVGDDHAGTVNFTWDGHSIGTAPLNASGVATLTRSNLNADSYPLTAVYSGDANTWSARPPS